MKFLYLLPSMPRSFRHFEHDQTGVQVLGRAGIGRFGVLLTIVQRLELVGDDGHRSDAKADAAGTVRRRDQDMFTESERPPERAEPENECRV